MAPSGLHYFPVTLPFLLALLALFVVVVGMAAMRLLRYASVSMGISLPSLCAILAFSLLGSYVNIPIAYLPEKETTTVAHISFFGVTYAVPVVHEWAATILAVNLGGAVIPVAVSLYLMAKHRLWALSALGVAIVAAICHFVARPVPGLGIAEPVLVPAAATAFVALLLSRRLAAPLAYVCGSLGTLIGADLLNLDKVQGLGAPVASIGGAGTFDGIFVTGLLAVLYAGLVRYAR